MNAVNSLHLAVTQFLADAAGADADAGEVLDAARSVMDASETATPNECDVALSRLLPVLRHENAVVGGLVAITGGALMEAGAQGAGLRDALMQAAPEVFARAAQFASQAEALLPPENDETGGEEGEVTEEANENEGLWLGERQVPAHAVPDLIARNAVGFAAWQSLHYWSLPVIAVLTRDKAVRKSVRTLQPDFTKSVARLAPVHDTVRNLYRLFTVLDDETILVLHPPTYQGFRVLIGGLADNFQLHTLLGDALIWQHDAGKNVPTPAATGLITPETGLTGYERPQPETVANAWGDSPQIVDVTSYGIWNLYKWTALLPDGSLPEANLTQKNTHWIWNEGKPADIIPFDGERTLLLGPPAYVRSWSTKRFFDGLPASVEVMDVLERDRVQALLRRMGAAALEISGSVLI